MRKIDPLVLTLPKLGTDLPEPSPSPSGSAFVIPQDAPDRRVVIQQGRGSRCGNYVDRSMSLGQAGKQWGGENDVAEESSLDDEDGRTVGQSVGHLMVGFRSMKSLSIPLTA
jgi:hypothetical protein